jgi:hypothetical protein
VLQAVSEFHCAKEFRWTLSQMFGDNEELPGPMAGQPGDANEQLWVEKYSPKSFTDLLSDEQINRQVTFLKYTSYKRR